MLTYITQALSVFDFEKYVDLQDLVVVCFFILKSMLTYITKSLSVLDFEKYADLHHPVVVCF